MTPRKAFTLIELLIVVAIIGILAAIAIPNFLNAQMRAKLARVKADFKAISKAMQSYHLDWNTYPIHYNSEYEYGRPEYEGEEYLAMSAGRALTTPVPYLSTGMLPDPFNTEQNPGYMRHSTITSGNYSRPDIWAGKPLQHRRNCFASTSSGPDDINTTYEGGFLWGPGMSYEISNGLRSNGNIYDAFPALPRGWIKGREVPRGRYPF